MSEKINVNKFTSVIVIAVMWIVGGAITYLCYRAGEMMLVGTMIAVLSPLTAIVWLTRDK